MKNSVVLTVLAIVLFGTGRIFAQTSTLIAVEENGPRGGRINIVFLSEGYTVSDLPDFATHVDNSVAYLFSREPWKQYRSYCNVYRIEVASSQSGTDNGTGGGLKDTYFDSGFTTQSVPQLLTISGGGQSKAYTLLNQHVPEYDMPIVIVNDPKYGGSGGSISVASVNSFSTQLVEHEVGHSFAGLADEYDNEYLLYTPRESYNATQQSSRGTVRWKSWIETPTPVPTPETTAYDDLVGVFEGANYRTSGWFRPHNNSVMRNLGRPVGSVNREKFVLTYYEKVGPVDGHLPAALSQTVTASETLTFSVQPKAPSEGPALTVQWQVDGVNRDGATGGEFVIPSGELGNGFHTVTALAADPSLFVRDDPAGLMNDTVMWSLNLSNQMPGTLANWRTTYGPDDSNPSGDGVNNIAKYALGLDPGSTAGPGELPSESLTEVSPSERYLTITVPRTVKRTDIDYMVRSSADLAAWNSGAGHTVVIEDSPTTLKVRDAVPVDGADSRYLDFSVREQ